MHGERWVPVSFGNPRPYSELHKNEDVGLWEVLDAVVSRLNEEIV